LTKIIKKDMLVCSLAFHLERSFREALFFIHTEGKGKNEARKSGFFPASVIGRSGKRSWFQPC
jgi:hypothetical protein